MSITPSADERTQLAQDRTVLAAERTFAAWLRTGLAFLASGLAAPRLLAGVLAAWQLHGLGTVLIACAAACFVSAGARDAWLRARLPGRDIHLLPRALTFGLSALLVVVSSAAALLLWVR